MTSSADVKESGIFDFEIYPLNENKISVCKGQNKKGLLVAMAGDERPELADFLMKILQAVGFDLQNDALNLWVTPSEQFWFKDLDRASPVSHAVFFGITPAQAGLNLEVPIYQPVVVSGKTFLFSDSLAKIQENPALKRPLWEALKIIFK